MFLNQEVILVRPETRTGEFWFATVFSLIWGIDWVRLGFKK
jgi:hypothetical protein